MVKFYLSELSEEDSLDIIDIFPEQFVLELDSPFSLEELMLAIYSLSTNKAPGPDMIPNSVLMSLPCESLVVLLEYFARKWYITE